MTEKSFTGETDLFGLQQQPKRIYDKPEAAALVEVLKALNTHPAVAWCENYQPMRGQHDHTP